MKSLKMPSNRHRKEGPHYVICLSDQFLDEREAAFGSDISLSPKVLQYFVRFKRQDNFVPPGLHERENIRKIAIRHMSDRPRTAPETRNLLSETEKSRRLPKLLGNAKPRKLLRTPVVI
jgi:hypothetical protein